MEEPDHIESHLLTGRLIIGRYEDDMEQDLFLLGDDFMPWMVLAFGAAMVVGNLAAMFRPPKQDAKASPQQRKNNNAPAAKPPVVRSLVMIAIGAVAAVWGAVSLLS